MSIIQWLRENYGWQAKKWAILLVVAGVLLAISILYFAERGTFSAL